MESILNPAAIPPEAVHKAMSAEAIMQYLSEAEKRSEGAQSIIFGRKLSENEESAATVKAFVLATRERLSGSNSEAQALARMDVIIRVAMFMGYQLAQAQLAAAPAVS
jgi:hypothetical protein